MKNREYRVLVTLALMASLVVGNIAGTSVNVQAADNKDKSTETKKTSETKTSSSATPAKDETVYVKVRCYGIGSAEKYFESWNH